MLAVYQHVDTVIGLTTKFRDTKLLYKIIILTLVIGMLLQKVINKLCVYHSVF